MLFRIGRRCESRRLASTYCVTSLSLFFTVHTCIFDPTEHLLQSCPLHAGLRGDHGARTALWQSRGPDAHGNFYAEGRRVRRRDGQEESGIHRKQTALHNKPTWPEQKQSTEGRGPSPIIKMSGLGFAHFVTLRGVCVWVCPATLHALPHEDRSCWSRTPKQETHRVGL